MTTCTFASAYETGLRRTISFLIYRGVRSDLAPDIAQTAWMRGWERLGTLRDDSAVVSWINMIAWNCYRQDSRSNRTLDSRLSEAQRTIELDSASVDIRKILPLCPPEYRSLFESQLLGHTTREIAGHLGVSDTAVRVRLHRAKRQVRALLGLPEKQAA